MRTKNFSSSPSERLLLVSLDWLHPHPANANTMSEERLAKLQRNIEREGRYPPIVVRRHPHEDVAGYQVLDGHQRLEVLRRLNYSHALCFVWPCDDETALILLATLNRLEGEDVPARRSQLLAELNGLMSAEDLAALLPENEGGIEDALDLLKLDPDVLLAEINAASERQDADAPRLISFVVLREDEEFLEQAIAEAADGLTGMNRRGRALGLICRAHLERRDG